MPSCQVSDKEGQDREDWCGTESVVPLPGRWTCHRWKTTSLILYPAWFSLRATSGCEGNGLEQQGFN